MAGGLANVPHGCTAPSTVSGTLEDTQNYLLNEWMKGMETCE